MDQQEHLTVGEFQRAMGALTETVERGFDRITEAQQEHGERIAVLEAASKAKSRRAASWGTAGAAVVVAAAEWIRFKFK